MTRVGRLGEINLTYRSNIKTSAHSHRLIITSHRSIHSHLSRYGAGLP